MTAEAAATGPAEAEQIMSGITKIVPIVVCLTVLTIVGRGAERRLIFSTIDFPGAILTNAQGINAGGR